MSTILSFTKPQQTDEKGRALVLLCAAWTRFQEQPFHGEGFALGSAPLVARIDGDFEPEDLASLCQDGLLIDLGQGSFQVSPSGQLWLSGGACRQNSLEACPA